MFSNLVTPTYLTKQGFSASPRFYSFRYFWSSRKWPHMCPFPQLSPVICSCVGSVFREENRNCSGAGYQEAWKGWECSLSRTVN